METLNTLKKERNKIIAKNWGTPLRSTPEHIEKVGRLTELAIHPNIDGIKVEGILTLTNTDYLRDVFKHYAYSESDNGSMYECQLDVIKVTRLAMARGIIEIEPPTNYCYNSAVLQQSKWHLTNGKGDKQALVQTVYIEISKVNLQKNKITVWFNPNKFINAGKKQASEPVFWFINTYIYPCITRPRLQQIHANVDIGINYSTIRAYDNKWNRKAHGQFDYETLYLNDGLKYYDDKGLEKYFDTYKGYSNTLAIYDKTTEISSKKSPSYYSKDELKEAKRQGISVTRFELRSYNALGSKRMLDNYSFLNNRFSIDIHYIDKQGHDKHKAFKDALNKAFKEIRDKVKGLYLVNNDIIKNTRRCTIEKNSDYILFASEEYKYM